MPGENIAPKIVLLHLLYSSQGFYMSSGQKLQIIRGNEDDVYRSGNYV
jgi:hypothetical protein